MRTYELVAGRTLESQGDAFDDDNGNVHEPAIDQTYWAGIAEGVDTRTYAPGQPVRRDQMASFIARLLNGLVLEGHAQPPSS